jgi:hypothetical protein
MAWLPYLSLTRSIWEARISYASSQLILSNFPSPLLPARFTGYLSLSGWYWRRRYERPLMQALSWGSARASPGRSSVSILIIFSSLTWSVRTQRPPQLCEGHPARIILTPSTSSTSTGVCLSSSLRHPASGPPTASTPPTRAPALRKHRRFSV